MSQPTVRRTYGKSKPANALTPSNSYSLLLGETTFSDISNHGSTSSPFSNTSISLPELISSNNQSMDLSSDVITPPSSPMNTRKRKSSPLIVSNEKVDWDSRSKRRSDLIKLDVLTTGKEFGKPAVQSSLKGFFTAHPPKRKDPLRPTANLPSSSTLPKELDRPSATPGISNGILFDKEIKPLESKKPTFPTASTSKTSSFTQLHLTHLPLLHTCPDCQMSYVRGGDDEGIHAKHHIRVIRGIPWDGLGRGKTRSKGKGKMISGDCGWRIVEENVRFGKDGSGRGKIIVADGSWGGSKLEDILSTVDTVLSAPPLPSPILDQCKIFLFITSSPPPLQDNRKKLRLSEKNVSSATPKDRVVGVVVSQGINWAMRVLRDGEVLNGVNGVDSGGGVICDPKPLSTPLGIHRIWTVPSYRGLHLAHHLLESSRRNTVYGCNFDPRKGQVAFSQPTESGRAVMEKWGGGNVRVFVDDESQL